MSPKRDFQLWLIFITTVLLSGLFAYLNFEEFITVGILNKIGGYPFGGEGNTPWHYKSSELYARVSLVSGVIFSIPFFYSFYCFVKKEKRRQYIPLLITLFLIMGQLIMGQAD